MEIVTARGPVNPSSLSLTNSHIHLVAMSPAWLYKTPTFLNDPDYALPALDCSLFFPYGQVSMATYRHRTCRPGVF